MIKTRSQKPPRLKCSQCEATFRQEMLAPDAALVCDGCSKKQQVFLFPAFTVRLGDPTTPDALPQEGEPCCYYCPDRKATDLCQDCGRHISEFLKVTIGGQTSCLTCLDLKRNDHDEPRLETRRTAHDNRVLALAALPIASIIGIFLWFYTIPATLFFLIKDWKQIAIPSILPVKRWKFILAGILAMVQLPLMAWAAVEIAQMAEAAAKGAAMRAMGIDSDELDGLTFEPEFEFNDL